MSADALLKLMLSYFAAAGLLVQVLILFEHIVSWSGLDKTIHTSSWLSFFFFPLKLNLVYLGKGRPLYYKILLISYLAIL